MIESPYFRAIFLGFVQGIAEFLPVSSSGHLVIIDEILLQFRENSTIVQDNMQLNISLHLGTLFSILVVYRKNLLQLIKQPRLIFFILIATIPLVLIGLSPLREVVKQLFNMPVYAGCGLLITSLMLFAGHRLESDKKSIEELTTGQAILIGLFQAFAIIPGVSRSGSTISAGLLTGMQRQSAAMFSFFIAIPAISGGACLLLFELLQSPDHLKHLDVLPLAAGGLSAFIVGWCSLRWLLTLLAKQGLRFFAWYCLVVGLATVIWQLLEKGILI